MKEGYLQTKISDLNEQLDEMNNQISTIQIHVQRIVKKIGDYDLLLDKLNDLEKHKTNVTSELYSQNKKFISDLRKALLYNIDKSTSQIINIKLKEMSKSVNEAADIAEKVLKYRESSYCNYYHINSILAYNHFLSIALVKKGILTLEDIKRFYSQSDTLVKKFLKGGEKKMVAYLRVKNGVLCGSD